MSNEFDVVEAGIADLRGALETGRVTAVELVRRYLDRIARFDHAGIRLNAVPVLNPDALAEAARSDRRRRDGRVRSPLEGIPYTAKDSFSVRGLTVAAGSPAFVDLVAGADAFAIEQLRAGGAILIGLTTMPPMACGGMQRGVYGRAESPYNADYLAAAYGSGSSNGSGVATSASFAAFGLGEETWSSGRSPASNNALVAYTPSRGVISLRGNWPLYVTCDVVVPHTRTMSDLFEVLDVLVADDLDARGDFWRLQRAVAIPAASAVRPRRYSGLADPDALRGLRIGAPRMYLGQDSSSHPVVTTDAVLACWAEARHALERAGATVVETDFPVVTNYEASLPGARSMVQRQLVPQAMAYLENWPLIAWAWNTFLAQNGDPRIRSLRDISGDDVFPHEPGTLPDRYPDDAPFPELIAFGQAHGDLQPTDLPELDAGLRGLEETRRIDFEQWMSTARLDLVAFPAAGDVAPSDADVNPRANDRAWTNGCVYSNGNLAIRHLGIPTVTVPMGLLADSRMPIGLTFAGSAYADSLLLSVGYAFERAFPARVPPPRTR